MKKHFKAIGAIIGVIALFKIISFLIAYIMKEFLNSNIAMELIKNTDPVKIGIKASAESIIIDVLVFLVLMVIYRKSGGLIKHVKLNKGYSVRKLRFIVPSVYTAMLIGGILSGVAVAILGSNKLIPILFNDMFRTPLGVVQAIIIAPILEETLLRGVLLNYLKKHWNVKVAIIVQALVFGFMHGNVAQGFNAFIGGILFGVIYLYTNSLWADITAHMLTNATVCLVTISTIRGFSGIVVFIVFIVIIISPIFTIKYYKKDVKEILKKIVNKIE